MFGNVFLVGSQTANDVLEHYGSGQLAVADVLENIGSVHTGLELVALVIGFE